MVEQCSSSFVRLYRPVGLRACGGSQARTGRQTHASRYGLRQRCGLPRASHVGAFLAFDYGTEQNRCNRRPAMRPGSRALQRTCGGVASAQRLVPEVHERGSSVAVRMRLRCAHRLSAPTVMVELARRTQGSRWSVCSHRHGGTRPTVTVGDGRRPTVTAGRAHPSRGRCSGGSPAALDRGSIWRRVSYSMSCDARRGTSRRAV